MLATKNQISCHFIALIGLLTKLVYFASNSERCNDLKIKLTMLKNEMQDYIRNNSIEKMLKK